MFTYLKNLKVYSYPHMSFLLFKNICVLFYLFQYLMISISHKIFSIINVSSSCQKCRPIDFWHSCYVSHSKGCWERLYSSTVTRKESFKCCQEMLPLFENSKDWCILGDLQSPTVLHGLKCKFKSNVFEYVVMLTSAGQDVSAQCQIFLHTNAIKVSSI